MPCSKRSGPGLGGGAEPQFPMERLAVGFGSVLASRCTTAFQSLRDDLILVLTSPSWSTILASITGSPGAGGGVRSLLHRTAALGLAT
jgi:hypothetical protein